MDVKKLPLDIQRKIYFFALSKYYYDKSSKLFEILLWNKLNYGLYCLYDDWNYNIVDKKLDLPLFNNKKNLLEYIKNSIFIYRYGTNNYNYLSQYYDWCLIETYCFKIKKYYMYITEIKLVDDVEYDIELNTKLKKNYQYMK